MADVDAEIGATPANHLARSGSYTTANLTTNPARSLDGATTTSSTLDDVPTFDPMAAARSFMARQDDTRRSSAFTGGMQKAPRSLQFENVSYTLKTGKKDGFKEKHILSNITGTVNPKEVLAIMGSSGAGKTSVLNLLAGRLPANKNTTVSGQIKIDGKPRDWDRFNTYAAYVLQDDRFFPELTVRETIAFSAALRLPESMSQKEKTDRVDSIIAELGLSHCQNTIVGNEMVRGISGGEKKRVNIGTELVSDPSLLFLDEPTSGLDSFNAQNVMLALQVLAKNGRTIIATIHQPRSNIYTMFDKLLLLSKGKTMYFGPQADAVEYFGSVGFPCPSAFNPADFFVDLISTDDRSEELTESSSKRIDQLAIRYEKYAATRKSDAVTQNEDASNTPKISAFSSSLGTQMIMLFKRSFSMVIREKLNNFTMMMMSIVFGIFLGLIWLEEGKNITGNSIQAIAGALFFAIINNAFNGVFTICNIFPLERNVVLKERASNTYHVGPYFLSKVTAEVPRTATIVLVFVSISYWMIGLRDDASSFFQMYAVILLTALCAEGIAYMVSAAAKDPQAAAAAGPGPLVLSMLFSGFFIGTDQIPPGLKWLRYFSFVKYAFACAMQIEFGDGRELSVEGCDTSNSFCPETGHQVLEYYSLNELSKEENFWILVAFAGVTRIFAFIILLRNVPTYVKK